MYSMVQKSVHDLSIPVIPAPDHDFVPRALSGNPTDRLPQRASIGGGSVQIIGVFRGVGYA